MSEPKPTDRQVQAYKYVFILDLSQEQAGDVMGITQPAVSQLLDRLSITSPTLFDNKTESTEKGSTLSYNELMDDDIVLKI